MGEKKSDSTTTAAIMSSENIEKSRVMVREMAAPRSVVHCVLNVERVMQWVDAVFDIVCADVAHSKFLAEMSGISRVFLLRSFDE